MLNQSNRKLIFTPYIIIIDLINLKSLKVCKFSKITFCDNVAMHEKLNFFSMVFEIDLPHLEYFSLFDSEVNWGKSI